MPDPSPLPRYESGGGKLIFGAAIIVVAALGGIGWSLITRQSAPPDAPPVKHRFLPPSERQERTPGTVQPAPTLDQPVVPSSSTAARMVVPPSPSSAPARPTSDY